MYATIMVEMKFLVLFVCLMAGSVNCFDGSPNFFERYSKLKLLSDCLGTETMARMKQQLLAASKQCDESPLFIPALLHEIPASLLGNQHNQYQYKMPPQYFVPNNPPALRRQQQHQTYVYPNHHVRQQNPFYVTPSLSHKIHYYVRQPNPSIVYPQKYQERPYMYSQQSDSQVVNTVVVRNDDSSEEVSDVAYITFNQKMPSDQGTRGNVGLQAPATQSETYTNPHLSYQDTEKFQHEQQILRNAQYSPTMGHNKSPVGPSHVMYNPSSRIQKREAGFLPTTYHHRRVEAPPAALTRDDRLRSLLRSRIDYKVSNMTCVMKAMKMIKDNLEPDIDFLQRSLLEMPVSNEIHDELKRGVEECRLSAPCQLKSLMGDDLPISREFSSTLQFFRCFGRERLRTCLKTNVEGMVRLLEKEAVHDHLSGFYGQPSQVGDAVSELEQLLLGESGRFVDMVLL